MDINRVYTDCNKMEYPAVLSTTFSNEGATEPVTRTEAKTWCLISTTDFDDIIDMLIPAARRMIEQAVNRSLITRTVAAVVYPKTILPYSAGSTYAIGSITDDNDDAVSGDYEDLYGMGKYTVTYTISSVAENVKLLKTAVLQQVAHMFENRGDSDAKAYSPAVASTVKRLRAQ